MNIIDFKLGFLLAIRRFLIVATSRPFVFVAAFSLTIFGATRRTLAAEPTEIVAIGSSFLENRQNGSEPAWIDYLAEDLGIPLMNLAVGGSGVPGGLQQARDYVRDHSPSAATLFVIKPGPKPYFQPTASDVVEWDYVTYEEKIGEMIQLLIDDGARNFFLPDLGLGFAPVASELFPGQGEELRALMDDFNSRQRARAESISAAGLGSVIFPGFFDLFRAGFENPHDLGFADGQDPGASSQFPELHVYWDSVHVTTAFHRLLADAAYLAILPDAPLVTTQLNATGGALSEDFDAALGTNDRRTGKKLPNGWTLTGPQRLIPETKVTQAFNRGRFGRTLGNGEVFNAGGVNEEDRALVTSVSRSDLGSEIDLDIDLIDGSPKAVRLAFDLEAWGVDPAVEEPGNVAFDVAVEGFLGEAAGASLFEHRITKDVPVPTSGENVNGNEVAYRTHFDSGVVDVRDAEIDRLHIRWSTISDVGSEGWSFGLDDFTLRTAVDGDANVDGIVDFGDFVALAANFGTDGVWEDGDFDQDGAVQFPDFVILANNFGHGGGTVAMVPEPAGFSLGLLAVILLGTMRRQRNQRRETHPDYCDAEFGGGVRRDKDRSCARTLI